jgi:tetratricopeptide (TPR) repeat protein
MKWTAKRYDAALQSALEAREVTERSGNRPAMAQSRYVLGEVRRSRTDFQQAIEEYSTAEDLQKQLRDPELGWRVLYGRGQTLEAVGKTADAISAYQNAIGIIEETRQGFPKNDTAQVTWRTVSGICQSSRTPLEARQAR